MPISAVGPRILIPKKKKYHLRLRTVHAYSRGRSVEVFCTTNLWAVEPKVACPVIKLPFLVWICLTESCLATCDFSRYLTLPLAICRKEKMLGQLFGSGLLTALWWAAAGLCMAPFRTPAAMQADPDSHAGSLALTNRKLAFPPLVLTAEHNLTENLFNSILDIHVLNSLFLYSLLNAVVITKSSGFPSRLCRENKISKLQTQVLENPTFPKVFPHFSKKNLMW